MDYSWSHAGRLFETYEIYVYKCQSWQNDTHKCQQSGKTITGKNLESLVWLKSSVSVGKANIIIISGTAFQFLAKTIKLSNQMFTLRKL